MSWVPVIAWLAAIVVAAVLLGFCAYELHWKANRLRTDLAKLQALRGELEQLQEQITATQLRAAQAQRLMAAGNH